MCLSRSKRKTTSAGVPRRPRFRLLGRRLARASYTVLSSCASSRTWSAGRIQSSHKSVTSSAMRPSAKPSWARRISITAHAPGPDRRIGPQQHVVQLADGLDSFLQLLVIAQPVPYLRNQFGTNAELASAAAGIADGQNGLRMSLTAGAFRAATGMTGSALDEGTAQDLARGGEAFEEPLTGLHGLPVSHVYR